MTTKLFGNYPTYVATTIANLSMIVAADAALSISYVGSQANIDSYADDGTTTGWHSSLAAKPLDIDGDNVLGTDGFIYTGKSGTAGATNPTRVLPTYFTDTDGVGWDVLAPSANAVVTGPDGTTTDVFYDAPTTLTANPSQAIGYTWWTATGPPQDSSSNMIQFTVNSNVTAALSGQTLRLGLLFDGVPSTLAARRLGTQAFTITQTVGGSATATSGALGINDDGMDVAFFDLTGLVAGDTFVINADSSGTTYDHLAGVTFDTAPIPEPSTALLGALGLLALLRRRR